MQELKDLSSIKSEEEIADDDQAKRSIDVNRVGSRYKAKDDDEASTKGLSYTLAWGSRYKTALK